MFFGTITELIDKRKKNLIEKMNEKLEITNYLLTFIIEKINEIIELNPPSIHFFSDLFEKNVFYG